MTSPVKIKDNIFLSVIIPAYNEERRIGYTVQKIFSYLNSKDYKSEVIIVDDGSMDNTVQIIESMDAGNVFLHIIRNKNNRGKGFSINKGVKKSRGAIILFSDADLSTPIEEIEKFMPFFDNGYDVVIGSRGLPVSDIQVRQVWYREWMGKKFGVLVRLLAVPGIRDSQCGFKCFTKLSAEKIFPRQRLSGFCFDVELLFISRKLNLRIKEVPVCWRNSPASRVKPFIDPVNMFFDLLRIRFYDIRGFYNYD